MVLTYFLNDFEMIPAAPIITGITLVFTFHICCIYYYYYIHEDVVLGISNTQRKTRNPYIYPQILKEKDHWEG
jgi:hypothetical protein